MGVYFMIGAITYKIDQEKLKLVCNAMGIIAALSIQSSATILTFISAYRLKSILFPYKRVGVKFIVILLVITWFAWTFVVSLPIFNEALFGHKFTSSIILNRHDGPARFELHKFITSIETLAQAVSCTTDKPVCQLLDALPHFLNNEVAIQLLKSFSLVDIEQENDFRNYYDTIGGCTVPLIFEAYETDIANFSLFFLFFNLVEYLFIFIACIIMCINISSFRFENFFPCVFCRKINQKHRPEVSQIVSENKQVYIRIFVVVVTDLISGMFGFSIGIAYYFDSLTYSSCSSNSIFRSWALLVSLLFNPLNSIINPYIYSYNLWKNLLKKCKQRLLECLML